MKQTDKRFRKVVKVRPLNGCGMVETAEGDWIGLLVLAIPFLGALFVLLYAVFRRREEYYVEIKKLNT